MKKITSTILLLLLALVGYATHLVSGDITYRRNQTFKNGDVEYEINLILIRDLEQSDVDFDAEVMLGVYDRKTLKLVDSIKMVKPVSYKISNLMCVIGSDASFEQATFSKLVTLKGNTNGYYVTWERCCKTIFENLQLDDSERPYQPFHLIADIPNTEIINSSPELPNLIQGFCVSTNTKWSFALFDRDGDSLSIALTPLIAGRGEPTQDMAIPPLNSVFTTQKTVLNAGYSFFKPFGTGVSMSIANNELGFNATSTGLYNVGILVREFRNGQLISSHTVDMAAVIFRCQNQGQDKPGGFFLDKYASMQALVNWNTCNNRVSHFEILRSYKDSNSFNVIDTVSRFTNRYIDSSLNQTGRYYYKVKGVAMAGGSSGETEARFIDLFPLGVDEVNSTSGVNIYPNPFEDEINVESEAIIDDVLLLNGIGQQVFCAFPKSQSFSMNIDLKPGLYFISINTGKANITQKLVHVK